MQWDKYAGNQNTDSLLAVANQNQTCHMHMTKYHEFIRHMNTLCFKASAQ